MIQFTHYERFFVRRTGVFDNVKSFSEFEKSIMDKCEELYPIATPEDADVENKNSAVSRQNNLKGMAFEMFWEYVVLSNVGGPGSVLGFKSSESTSRDKYFKGIDREDIMKDGSKGITQVKFSGNPMKALSYGRLATLLAEWSPSVKHITIVTNIFNEKKLSHTGDKGCLHYDTVRALKTKQRDMRAMGSDLQWRVFGREFHEQISNSKEFWDDLRTSLEASCQVETRLALPDKWSHQEEAAECGSAVLLSDTVDRGQVIIPTAGGKSRIEWEMTGLAAKPAPRTVVVLAPWIDLLKQLKNDFHNFGNEGWDYLDIRTGDQNELTEYGDGCRNEQLMDPAEIAGFIEDSHTAGRSVMIFSTYASAGKLLQAAEDLGEDFVYDLTIGDEAHHMAIGDEHPTTSDLNALLTSHRFKKWLFFTATRKIGLDHSKVGMNNEKLFGKILYRTSLKKLADEGIVVLPKLRIVRTPVGESKEISMAGIIKCLQLHEESRTAKSKKVLMFNDSVEHAHEFSDGDILKSHFPADRGWTHLAISSNSELMGDVKRREIYRKFNEATDATLWQYGIVKEGIDIPGITAVVFDREAGTIVMVQGIGRSLRLVKSDREKLKAGLLKVNDPAGWDKPHGEVFVIVQADDEETLSGRVRDLIERLHTDEGYGNGDFASIELIDAWAEDNKKEGSGIPPFGTPPDPTFRALSAEKVERILPKCFEDMAEMERRENAAVELMMFVGEVKSKTDDDLINSF